jgi:glycosyltransferase involved in cell wall biosynthesis
MAELVSTYRRHIENRRIGQIRFEPQAGDVLFAPAYWHDVEPAIYHGYRARSMHIVILVHDILPVLFENFYPSPWRYMFRNNVRAAFDYASAFLCVSNYTRAALREFGLRNRLNAVPMMTSYNGFEPLVDDDAAIEIKEKKPRLLMGNGKLLDVLSLVPLLMVGSVEPKKGHVPVIQCLESLWTAGYDRPLCIIGRTGWMERDVVAAIRESFFFNKKIFWFSAADDLDLAYAYISCHALIFSSLAEGFGLPMIEASYYGKPTIVLDTPIAREILGNDALLFDSVATFVQHLVNLEDNARYKIACQFADSVRWPLWEDYTPKVFDHLASFLSGAAELPELAPTRSEKLAHLRKVSA